MFCQTIQQYYGDLIQFALAMSAYTYGALLGSFLLALLPTGRNDLGLLWGAPLSMATVFALSWQSEASQVVVLLASIVLVITAMVWLRRRPWGLFAVVFFVAVLVLMELKPLRSDPLTGTAVHFSLAWPWHYPIGTLITLVVGYVAGERRKP